VPADLLSTATAQRANTIRIEFHPSVSLLQSRFPIVSIWKGIRSNRFTLHRWTSELALIAEQPADVQAQRASTDEYVFLTALARRRSLADAVSSARVANAEFSTDRAVALLIGLNIVTGLHDLRKRAHAA
jgi:hypothetical protein